MAFCAKLCCMYGEIPRIWIAAFSNFGGVITTARDCGCSLPLSGVALSSRGIERFPFLAHCRGEMLEIDEVVGGEFAARRGDDRPQQRKARLPMATLDAGDRAFGGRHQRGESSQGQ